MVCIVFVLMARYITEVVVFIHRTEHPDSMGKYISYVDLRYVHNKHLMLPREIITTIQTYLNSNYP